MQCDSARLTVMNHLAECIARAYMLSGCRTDYNSDIYWHTRERVMEIARSYGIKTQQVLERYKQQFRWIDPTTEFGDNNPFWYSTMHPDLLVKEVHDS